ncbi:TolB family protein [Gracilimonas mengyeensis]|uniref:WD40-like Beta Propeller Repeat n=1 Tax=Gracilimonas mengyeensis TaxID=1302730 RepID=A0A521F3K6_9BACT|nr:PD40 domain-containing protein [Gracilimonas mengyeensis]SMO90747.1 WD40-like Beta Propeller Repeat [Gracilimonas mengyeensis]
MKYIAVPLLLLIAISCTSESPKETYNPANDTLKYEQEVHLQNVRQLTFGGDNAEAYWSYDSEELIFQSNNPEWGVECDQIFTMDISSKEPGFESPMISTGNGRTTCSYFLPGDSTFVYSSTHASGPECPTPPERGAGGAYVWPVYDTYDIYKADMDGNIIAKLTDEPGYDAEPTVSPQGDKIVFTSDRSGDLELYIMDTDGSNVIQITDELGYDGGAFFSPDGTQLVFRASRPETEEEITKYKNLLEQGLVEPTNMELFIVNVEGTGLQQITELGNANWAPYFHPSGEKIVFSSNHQSSRGFPFNIFMINVDGTGLEQITFDAMFDSFPMFSPDGKKIVFSSNRNNGGTRSTNVFVADWVE